MNCPNFLFLVLCLLGLWVHVGAADVVSIPQAKSKIGVTYAQGCSGFVADMLGKPFKMTQHYKQGDYIGKNGVYNNVNPGEIIGYDGHVGIYLGEKGAQFIDVNGAGNKVRTLNGYGTTEVYKYHY